jgi:hypothetical protein
MRNFQLILCFSFLLVITITSCDNKEKRPAPGFYCETMADYDVWRLPVVKPIALITAYIDAGEWNVFYEGSDSAGRYFYSFISADSINYAKRKLLIYSSYNEPYRIIDIDMQKDTIFPGRNQYLEYISKNQLPETLYHVRTLYYRWKQTKVLPWAKELTDTIDCNK